METRPEQPPEGRLIHDAANRLDLSIREAAKRAGISYGRWRQIVMGYQNISPGVYGAVHAPAKTVAKMAKVVGVTPAELTKAGREDAAAILAERLRPEPAPESSRETAAEDPDADAMESAVIVAATPRKEREIWAEIRHALQNTPAGAELLADPAQARAWPAGSAPVRLTPEAIAILDATPADLLLSDPAGNAAIRLEMDSWHKRVQWAAAGRAIFRPTSAVRRAG